MKYIEYINNLIKEEISRHEKVVSFGQNINAGSCLSGLTKNLPLGNSRKVINAINAENTLCGFGFGLMLCNQSGIFFMKQLDFLLLGIDQLANTYNIIRSMYKDTKGSFTIFPIIVDMGYQGPQSSLNNFADFCSIARIAGYTITNKVDAGKIISSQLISPGFRIIGVSQRLFNTEIIAPQQIIFSNEENTLFQYSQGQDITIVCFNFSFPHGWHLSQEFQQQNINVSLFNINSPTPIDWSPILKNLTSTKNLIVIDDSKSENIAAYSLLANLNKISPLQKQMFIKRKLGTDWLKPQADQLEINYVGIIEEFKKSISFL